jgi:hypothetical protein
VLPGLDLHEQPASLAVDVPLVQDAGIFIELEWDVEVAVSLMADIDNRARDGDALDHQREALWAAQAVGPGRAALRLGFNAVRVAGAGPVS